MKEQLSDEDLPRVLERLTAYVAYQLHGHPDYPNALADKRALSGWLATAAADEPALASPRKVEDAVQDLLGEAANLSGFFVQRGEGVYGFLHRQFQEYFAAVYLVRQALAAPEPAVRWQPILTRLADPNWQEVILLAVGILEREAVSEVAALLTALLTAPDPTAGVLAHPVLLTATAVAELQYPPPHVVQPVAAGLIVAYSRQDEARFAVLKQPVETAFSRLPRPHSGHDPARDAFCRALTGSAGDDEAGRFLRLAAGNLILQTQWYTPAIARALVQAWRSYVEPAGTMLLALQQIRAAHPDYFTGQFLPVRRQWAIGWREAVDNEAWAALLWALYLDPAADAPAAEMVVRDSLLTVGLQALLRPTPAGREKLLAWLRQQWQTADGPARRDAGLALWYLGDTETLLPFLLDGEHQERTAVFRRSLLAVTALDLDSALALDLTCLPATLSEIGAILENQLQKPDTPLDVQETLLQAQAKLLRLTDIVAQRRGVWHVWQAWGDALAGQESPLDWSGRERLRVTLAHLPQLMARLVTETDPGAWPRLDATPLADLPEADKTAAQTLLTSGWQTALETTASAASVQTHLALLLAEMKVVRPETLPWLMQTITTANDLTRYRAQAALQEAYGQPASVSGREAIEALAHYDAVAVSLLADTIQSWSLNKVQHDQPNWLQAWLAADDDKILSHIHYLTEQTWPIFLTGLAEASVAIQVQMLDATSWLLRSMDKETIPADLRETLFALCRHADSRVQEAALTALGHWRSDPAGVLPELLVMDQAWQDERLAAYLTAVARLTAQVEEADVTAQGESALRQRLPAPAALAALSRLLVRQQGEKITLPALWAFVSGEQTVPATTLLPALLQAGTDDDGWDIYHETIARLIQELVQEEEKLLARLLAALQDALDEGEDSWPSRRIALAAVAACAAAMPDALNSVWPAEEVTALLIAGTKYAGSFTSRRHGILALSHLRTLTPAVLAALLDASQDVYHVQQDAVTAAGQFRLLHPDFGDADALASLEAALQGESGAAAYVAAQVLGSLGSSQAGAQIPGLRARIAAVLSAAAQNERAGEVVYLLDEYGRVQEAGTRAQVILAALSQVWALPGR